MYVYIENLVPFEGRTSISSINVMKLWVNNRIMYVQPDEHMYFGTLTNREAQL